MPLPFTNWLSARLNRRIRTQARIWLVPAAYILAALLLGRLVPLLDRYAPITPVLFSMEAASAMLSAIVSGMITFTGVVFSLSLLMIQFSSSAYSPRLARFFLEDAIVQHALGVFTATFVYALMDMAFIDSSGSAPAPQWSVILALLMVLASVGFFLALMQNVTSLQVTSVLRRIADIGRKEIYETYPPLPESAAEEGLIPADVSEKPVTQVVRHSGGPLVVVEVRLGRLVSLGRHYNAIIKVEYPVGDKVPNGGELLRVLGCERHIPEGALRRAVILGAERTIDQDPKYGLRLIVDIAIRALSPAINDPTTAVQALDEIEDLLRRIARRRLNYNLLRDRERVLRVISPSPTWEDFLDLAIDEVRYYGARSIQVMRRLLALLVDLRQGVPAERRAAVEHHLERVRMSIQRTFTDAEDRADAEQFDRQGFGLGRSLMEQDATAGGNRPAKT